MGTITHKKTNNIAAWTQADLNAQIALGNYPAGTLITDITLSSDWNDTHNITLTTDDISEGATNLYFTNTRVHGAISAIAPLIFDSSSGIFSITKAGSSSDGYLSTADWNTFNNKLSSAITNLNGLTAATQVFTTGTSGVDFNINSTGAIHTFNIPDAGTSARGLVTTGAQSFNGVKTFIGQVNMNSGTLITGIITANRTATPAGSNGATQQINTLTLTGNTNTTNGGFLNEFIVNFNNTGSNTYQFSNTAGTGMMGLGGSTAALAGYIQVSNTGSLTDSQAFASIFTLSNAGNITNAVGFRSEVCSATAAGRITNHEGFRAEDQTLTAVVSGSIYGFRGRVQVGTNKYNLFMDGTAQNYLAGSLGIGQPVPTAILHLKAGAAAASSAPLKFTSGTNQTTAEPGAVEYNGTNLFFTRTGTTRENVFVGNDGATPPATHAIGVIADYYGASATRVLTTPNNWASVVVNGATYKIPLYT